MAAKLSCKGRGGGKGRREGEGKGRREGEGKGRREGEEGRGGEGEEGRGGEGEEGRGGEGEEGRVGEGVQHSTVLKITVQTAICTHLVFNAVLKFHMMAHQLCFITTLPHFIKYKWLATHTQTFALSHTHNTDLVCKVK